MLMKDYFSSHSKRKTKSHCKIYLTVMKLLTYFKKQADMKWNCIIGIIFCSCDKFIDFTVLNEINLYFRNQSVTYTKKAEYCMIKS